MQKIFKNLKYWLLGLLVIPWPALALVVACPTGIQCTAFSPAGFIGFIVYILLGVAGLIAVLFLIIGGFQYITSGANEELAETGKKTIQNAIIGIVIIILSFVIVSVVSSSLGVNVTSS